MIAVIDAGLVVDVLLGRDRARRAPRWTADAQWVAPAVLDLEVCSSLARLERAGELDPLEADTAATALRALPVQRLETSALVARAWRLRRAVRVSDAFYVAAAAIVDAPLVTTDARLGRAGLTGVTIAVVA